MTQFSCLFYQTITSFSATNGVGTYNSFVLKNRGKHSKSKEQW
jgi:hypothetical protein